MSVSKRSAVIAAGLVVAVALGGGSAVHLLGSTLTPTDSAQPVGSGDPVALYFPDENGSAIWPYTSRSRSFEGRTLAINVILYGEPDRVRDALRRQTDAEWNRTNESESEQEVESGAQGAVEVEVNGTKIDWGPARGATRYTLFASDPESTTWRWVDESYQLHVGDYLGKRYHIRAYESPDGERWTAMQAHEEYWDWFRLRHTVTGTDGAQRFVENDFRDEPFVSEVRRTWTGERWITEIDLVGAALTLLLGTATSTLPGRVRREFAALRETVDPIDATLFGISAGFYLGVRLGGVLLERAFPEIPTKAFAGMLYPLLAVFLPLLVVVLARRSTPLAAFAAAAAGLGAAFVVDFAALGLTVVPVDVALQRVATVVALGLLAAGGANRASDEPDGWLLAGVACWIAALGLPLFGLV